MVRRGWGEEVGESESGRGEEVCAVCLTFLFDFLRFSFASLSCCLMSALSFSSRRAASRSLTASSSSPFSFLHVDRLSSALTFSALIASDWSQSAMASSLRDRHTTEGSKAGQQRVRVQCTAAVCPISLVSRAAGCSLHRWLSADSPSGVRRSNQS